MLEKLDLVEYKEVFRRQELSLSDTVETDWRRGEAKLRIITRVHTPHQP